MKTAEINLNYDFTGKDTVEIENNMAPLHIGASESGQVEIKAELNLGDPVSDTDLEKYFNVKEDGNTIKIELEKISELAGSMFGANKSQVWIRVPKDAKVIAKSEIQPIKAEGLAGEVVIHNENGPIKLEDCAGNIHLENENGPIKLENCDGHIKLQNENGPIKLHGCSAGFEIKIENGPLVGEKISGEKLEIESANGPIKIRLAAFPKVNITNENGVIYYETLPVEDGEFSFVNENGVLNLVLPQDFDFDLDAETNVGTISTTIEAEISSQDGHKFIRKGEGGARISVKTENGVIKLSTDAHSDMGFIKLKIKDLKKTIGSAVGPEDREKVEKAMQGAISSIEKVIGSINEDKIKEKLTGTLEKLKNTVESFDFKETSGKVAKSVDQIGDEVMDTLKTVFRKVKEAGEEKVHEHVHGRGHDGFSGDSLKEYISKAIDSAFAKAQGKGLSGKDKQEVDERSRAKILEMLENGKITAEEAERLLKAISPE